jgi:tRNA A37 N6-isopentenylltransferase MiaA
VTPEVLALVGPTSSGKTALSIEVARRLDAEIISMDSRSVFRGMDVGTAKPTPEERGGVPHHGIDLVEPDVRFSAGEFARYARPKIAEIRGRGRVPMLVGGTGFFLRALTHPIFREPDLDPVGRAQLAGELEALDDAALLERLREVDPEAAAKLPSWGGRQRIMRGAGGAAAHGTHAGVVARAFSAGGAAGAGAPLRAGGAAPGAQGADRPPGTGDGAGRAAGRGTRPAGALRPRRARP